MKNKVKIVVVAVAFVAAMIAYKVWWDRTQDDEDEKLKSKDDERVWN